MIFTKAICLEGKSRTVSDIWNFAMFTHDQPANTKLILNLQNNSLFNKIKARWGANEGYVLHSPLNNQPVLTLRIDTAEVVRDKITKISNAFKPWSSKTPKERSELLKSYGAAISKNRQELAELLSVENGKPLAESFGEVGYGMNACDWFAAQAKREYGQTIPSAQKNHTWLTKHYPIGPVATITPWNFPASMVTRKTIPAIAAGCTVVLKPASQTPLSAFGHKLVAEEAGIPEDVFEVIFSNNSREVGPQMFSDERIKACSFTGSTGVGKLLMKHA